MKRRLAVFGIVGIALALGAEFSALSVSRRRNEKVTLKSRVLAYEASIQRQKPFPSKEEIDLHVTQLMSEYFQIGMSEEECVRVLISNDLNVNELGFDEPNYRALPRREFFHPTIVAVIELQSWNPLISFQYRLIFRFLGGKLVEVLSSRVGTGP